MARLIALIGPNDEACTPEVAAFGRHLGQALAVAGFNLVNGGMGGFMAAVFEGAKSTPHGAAITTIGILPGNDARGANPWCDIALPTGMGIMRNMLVVRSGDCIVAVGGGAGTLSEIALAWQLGKRVICVEGLGGWSESLAGKNLDSRHENLLVPVRSVEEAMVAIQGC